MNELPLNRFLQSQSSNDLLKNLKTIDNKNLLEQIQKLLPPSETSQITDSLLSNYTVSKILEALQIPIEESSIKITEAFLKSGVLPDSQDMIAIQELLKRLPTSENYENSIQKAVILKNIGADLKEPFVQEIIVQKNSPALVIEILQNLKTEVITNKVLPIETKAELNQLLDSIIKEYKSNIKQTTDLNLKVSSQTKQNTEQFIRILQQIMAMEQPPEPQLIHKIETLLNPSKLSSQTNAKSTETSINQLIQNIKTIFASEEIPKPQLEQKIISLLIEAKNSLPINSKTTNSISPTPMTATLFKQLSLKLTEVLNTEKLVPPQIDTAISETITNQPATTNAQNKTFTHNIEEMLLNIKNILFNEKTITPKTLQKLESLLLALKQNLQSNTQPLAQTASNINQFQQTIKASLQSEKLLTPQLEIKIDKAFKEALTLLKKTSISSTNPYENLAQNIKTLLPTKQTFTMPTTSLKQNLINTFQNIKQVIQNAIRLEINQSNLLKQTSALMQAIESLTQNQKPNTSLKNTLEPIFSQWESLSVKANQFISASPSTHMATEGKIQSEILNSFQQLKNLTLSIIDTTERPHLLDKLNHIPSYIKNQNHINLNEPYQDNSLQTNELTTVIKAIQLTETIKTQLKSFIEEQENNNLLIAKHISSLAETTSQNLFTLQQLLSAIPSISTNVPLQSWLDKLEEMLPDFIKFFKLQIFTKGDTPELQKIKTILQENFGAELTKYQKNMALKTNSESKMIYTPQLKHEIESIEKQFFKLSEFFTETRKLHENILRSESRLLTNDFFERNTSKQDAHQSFEFRLSSQIEELPTRINFYQKKNSERHEHSEENVYISFYLDCKLKQAGEIKANIISLGSKNQIHLSFEKLIVKEIAQQKQESLEKQLQEIPFYAQIFLHDLISITPALSNKKPIQGFDQHA